jgi:4-nitrophenyl phosphatase
LNSFNLPFEPDPAVAAVVCGLDTSINYTKLSKAFQYLTRNEGCLFIATNEDSTYPTNGGLLPGAGSISAPLRYSLKRDPVSTGKPHATMLDCVKAKWVVVRFFWRVKTKVAFRHNYDPKKTLMIGDRLDTDIQFGKNGGLDTLLVLSGK